MRSILAFFAVVLVAACGDSPAATTSPIGALPAGDPVIDDARALAADICSERGLAGFTGPADLVGDAAAADLEGVTAESLHGLVFAECPAAFYRALSADELSWCGTGHTLSNNYFNVIEAGLNLGLPAFVNDVDPQLLERATDRHDELSDEEVIAFAASLSRMDSSPGFDRDWATACRSTF